MKARTLWLILLLVFALLFISCDNDDSSDNTSSNSDDDDDTSGDDDDDDDDNNDDDNDTGPEPLSIVFEFPPVAPPNQEYEYHFTAQGGQPPYSNWAITHGAIPENTSLDAGTGILSGTPTDEGLSYFVVEVEDAAGAKASDAFGIRVGNPNEDGPLLQKARAYQAVYDLRHNSDGLSVTADNPDDPSGDYWYTDLGDACFIHGNSSAGAAFWHAVENNATTLANAQLHARGLDLLNRVNGVPGLMSRSYMPKTAPMGPNEFQTFYPENDNHEGTGDFADYYWKGDVSLDQYSGALVGLSLLYDMVDDESVRTPVRQTIVEIADYLIAGNLIIYDVDGEPTKYGDFRGNSLEGFPLPNGLNSAACLAWFKLAHHVSGESRFLEMYETLINDRNYHNKVKNFIWVYLGYSTKHYNVYMAFENMYTLTRLEDDPYLLEFYIDGFTKWLWESSGPRLAWRRAKVEANPTFTPWYLYSTGKRFPEGIMNSIWQLDVFVDAPLRDRYIENSANPDIEKNPEKPELALYPLPANLRKPDMCIWHRSPYTLDGGEDNGRERTGHDYLLPYWMGRYYGYISPTW